MAAFGFCDPPYPGNAKRHYAGHPDYAGEVDHEALIRRICAGFDGWALCTSVKALPYICRILPEEVLGEIITLTWWKTQAPPLGDHRRYNIEPVIVKPVRYYGPGYVPIAMISAPVDGYTWRETPEEHVTGQKPEAFAHWVYAAAGLDPALDTLDDLFPGSGAMTKAWATYKPGPTVADGYRAHKDALKREAAGW